MPVIRQIPRAHWLASLVQSMSSRFNERPHLKQGRVFKKRVLLLMSRFQMHAWPGHVHTQKHMHTTLDVFCFLQILTYLISRFNVNTTCVHATLEFSKNFIYYYSALF